MTASGGGSGARSIRPFPGLRPFGYEDREFFCGRTAQIYALYRMLDRSRFVAVVGSSGSGKSSLVFAGLHPLLEKDSAQPGGRGWVWQQMSPKNAPLEGLIDLVAKLAADHAGAGIDQSFIAAQHSRIDYLMRLSTHGLVDALAEIEGLKDKTLVLLVDQFEELFRYAKGSKGKPLTSGITPREQAVQFVQLLLAASHDSASRVHVLITMRSDFIGDCADFQGLPEAVSETQFLVPGLKRDQLEEIIRKPLEGRATIESRLVERLLNDAADEADQLPVLQHCLFRLWEASSPEGSGTAGEPAGPAEAQRHITLGHYEAVGRLADALSRHADEILGKLPEPIVERVFRALSAIDKEGRATRRELTFSRLVAETGDDESDVRNVVDRFRADDCSFLRPVASDTATLVDDTPVDVGHEALLRRWRKVSGDPDATGAANDTRPIGWLRSEEEDGRRYQALLYRNELPPSEVADTLAWWRQRPNRSPAWADRYGNRFEQVQKLLSDGQKALAAERSRQLKFRRLAYAGIALVLLNIIGAGIVTVVVNGKLLRSQQYAIEVGTRLISESLKRLESEFNRGDLSANAASETATYLETQFNDMETLASATEIRSIFSAPLQILARIPGLGWLGVDQPGSTIKPLHARMLLTLSDVFVTLGNSDKAYDQAESARAIAEQLTQAEPANDAWQELLYGSLFRIGDVLVAPGDKNNVEQGLATYRRAQDIAKKRAAGSTDGDRLYFLAFIDNKVGETLQQKDEFEAAMLQYKDALQIAMKIAAMPDAKIEWQAYLPSTLAKIGRNLVDMGQVDAGIATYADAITRQEQIINSSTANNDIVLSNLLTTHRLKGNALVRQGATDPSKFMLAYAEFDAATALARQLVGKDSANANWLTSLALAYAAYGAAKIKAGDLPGALVQYQSEVEVRQRLVNKDRTNPVWQRGLATAQKKVREIEAKLAGANGPGGAAPASGAKP